MILPPHWSEPPFRMIRLLRYEHSLLQGGGRGSWLTSVWPGTLHTEGTEEIHSVLTKIAWERFVCVMLCFTWSCTCLAQNKRNNYYQQWSDGIELNIAPQARKFYCAAQRQTFSQGTHRFGFENTCCKCSDSSKITDPGPDPLTRGPLTRGRLTFPGSRGGGRTETRNTS